jgi:hypothetical protein
VTASTSWTELSKPGGFAGGAVVVVVTAGRRVVLVVVAGEVVAVVVGAGGAVVIVGTVDGATGISDSMPLATDGGGGWDADSSI